MYLSSKLFRSAQTALNLNLPDASTPQEAQVRASPFPPPASPSLQLSTGVAPPLPPLQIPEVVVSAESSIPRDASGAIDYSALAQLLRDTQSLQDQAEILYILFKDK